VYRFGIPEVPCVFFLYLDQQFLSSLPRHTNVTRMVSTGVPWEFEGRSKESEKKIEE
jgi:hypothetical protein